MRLWRIDRAGEIDGLALHEAPSPEPRRGQVLVRMRAVSLNYRDLMVVEGRYARGAGVAPGLVPCSDGAGEVVAVGEDVDRVRPGDRVCGIFMQRWLGGAVDKRAYASSLGGAIDGVLAEQVAFDQEGLVRIPEHLSYAEAATLPCAAVTAWNALFGATPVRPGQNVLLLGTGGVSMFGLQFARLAGARAIVTSSSDAKLDRARALGAGATVNYRTHPEWEREVRALTDGLGVDHVLEVGGAGTLPRSVRATRMTGQVHLIGVLTGGEIDPSGIMRGNVSVRGVYVGSREMFEDMNRAIALHELRPEIDRAFGFDDARAAWRHLKDAGHVGKVVITLD